MISFTSISSRLLPAFIVFCLSPFFAEAQNLQVASPFTNHMVLQRELPVPVWGTAAAGSVVEVQFGQQKVAGTTNDQGRWRVTLDPLAGSADSQTLTRLDERQLAC